MAWINFFSSSPSAWVSWVCWARQSPPQPVPPGWRATYRAETDWENFTSHLRSPSLKWRWLLGSIPSGKAQEKWLVIEDLSWEMRFTNSSANQIKKITEHRSKIWAHGGSSNPSLPAQGCSLQIASPFQLVSPTCPKDGVSRIIHNWEIKAMFALPAFPFAVKACGLLKRWQTGGERRWIRNQRVQQTPVSNQVESQPKNPELISVSYCWGS